MRDTCILTLYCNKQFHFWLQVLLHALFLFAGIDLSLYFSVVILITFAEDPVDKYICLHAPINFPKTVHIHLPDKRSPLTMPEIFGQQLSHKFIIIMDMHFSAIFRKWDNLWVLLTLKTRYTSIIECSLRMKSGICWLCSCIRLSTGIYILFLGFEGFIIYGLFKCYLHSFSTFLPFRISVLSGLILSRS